MSKLSQYKVIIEQDSDGYFVASVPALPGCVTQAKTLVLLQKRIREAIALCQEISATDPDYRRRLREFSYEPNFVGLDLVAV